MIVERNLFGISLIFLMFIISLALNGLCHSPHQSDVKLLWIATWSYAFSRAWTLWMLIGFLWPFSSALIGRCNYFGFWFYDTQYKTPQSVNVLNDIKSCSPFNLLGDYFSNMHRKPSLPCHFCRRSWFLSFQNQKAWFLKIQKKKFLSKYYQLGKTFLPFSLASKSSFQNYRVTMISASWFHEQNRSEKMLNQEEIMRKPVAKAP